MSSTKGINRQDLAVRITAAIEATGESQRAIAGRVGVAQSFISKAMRGASLPSLELVVGLNEHYGVRLDWLLRGDGQMRCSADNVRCSPVKQQTAPIIELAETAVAIGGETLTHLEGYMRGYLAAHHHQPQRARAG